jgi:hypothetical protein
MAPKARSSTDGSGGSQDQTGSGHESLTDDEAKHDMKKGTEEVATEQNKAQGKKAKVSAEAGASSQQ